MFAINDGDVAMSEPPIQQQPVSKHTGSPQPQGGFPEMSGTPTPAALSPSFTVEKLYTNTSEQVEPVQHVQQDDTHIEGPPGQRQQRPSESGQQKSNGMPISMMDMMRSRTEIDLQAPATILVSIDFLIDVLR